MKRVTAAFSKVDTTLHSVKNLRIRSFSDPYFPAFELNTERYGISLRIQSECGKIQTRKTPNTDTFHAELSMSSSLIFGVVSSKKLAKSISSIVRNKLHDNKLNNSGPKINPY